MITRLTGTLSLILILAACGSDGSGQDTAEETPPDTAGDSQPDSVDDTPEDTLEEEAPLDCFMPGPEEQAALEGEAQAYIVGDDDTLPDRLETDWPDVCFEAVAEAIRAPHPADDATTGVVVTSFPLSAGSVTLHIFVPPTAVLDGSMRVPLIVSLHGAGDSGANYVNLPSPRTVANTMGGIVAVPTATSTCDWSATDGCARLVHYTIHTVKGQYPIDDDRVYITGFSMGGRGSYTDGLTWPDMFAGVLPIAGTIGACHGTLDLATHRDYVRPHIENALHQRVRIMTGLSDHEYLVAQNEAASEVFAELGYDFIWDAMAGVGHTVPTGQYDTAITWVTQHSRETYPTQVLYNMAEHLSSWYDDLYLNNTLRTNVYWVRIDSRVLTIHPARVEGSIDGQSVTLTTENVQELSVYLADELLDMDRFVTIEVDGEVWFEGLVDRDPAFALEHARERRERTMVFAAHVQSAVP